VNRFRPLTVPELRDELAKRDLDNKNGKKAQLLMRLAIWTRDEIAKSCKEEMDDNNNKADEHTEKAEDDGEPAIADVQTDVILLESDDDDDDDSDDEDSVVSRELEISPVGKNGEDGELGEEDVMESNDEAVDDTDEPSSEDLDTPLSVLQSVFGHTNFRQGQEWAISRCLAKQKSILVAPTGFGKSLCYALPAALMDGVCVVVSPLISLIEVRNIWTVLLDPANCFSDVKCFVKP
jgi:hypothetical protein